MFRVSLEMLMGKICRHRAFALADSETGHLNDIPSIGASPFEDLGAQVLELFGRRIIFIYGNQPVS